MANIRDPVRDKIKEYYETHKISIKKLAEHFNISENTIKSWKNRDKKNGNDWVQLVDVEGATKGAVADNKKKQIIKAKTMVISGSTLEEASTKTNININTLKTYSAKEKWIDQQEKFMQEVYKEVQEFYTKQHIEDRKLSVTLLHNLMVKTFSEERQGTIDVKEVALRESIANLFIKSIKGQSDILGIPEMKMYIRQDKEDKEEKIKDRTINIKVVK